MKTQLDEILSEINRERLDHQKKMRKIETLEMARNVLALLIGLYIIVKMISAMANQIR